LPILAVKIKQLRLLNISN